MVIWTHVIQLYLCCNRKLRQRPPKPENPFVGTASLQRVLQKVELVLYPITVVKYMCPADDERHATCKEFLK
jgi:hypothetical protein